MVQEVAHEMIKSGINDYLISGFEEVMFCIVFTIVGAILIKYCVDWRLSDDS